MLWLDEAMVWLETWAWRVIKAAAVCFAVGFGAVLAVTLIFGGVTLALKLLFLVAG